MLLKLMIVALCFQMSRLTNQHHLLIRLKLKLLRFLIGKTGQKFQSKQLYRQALIYFICIPKVQKWLYCEKKKVFSFKGGLIDAKWQTRFQRHLAENRSLVVIFFLFFILIVSFFKTKLRNLLLKNNIFC
jgi:hypothetical protein